MTSIIYSYIRNITHTLCMTIISICIYGILLDREITVRNVILSLVLISATYILTLSIHRLWDVANRYTEIYQDWLLAYMLNNPRSPLTIYAILYMRFMLTFRSIIVIILEYSWGHLFITSVSFYLCLFLILKGIWQGLLVGPILLSLDLQSAAIAAFANRQPHLLTVLRTPIFAWGNNSSYDPENRPSGRRYHWAIRALGGPKVVFSAALTAVGGSIAFIAHQYFETQRHRETLALEMQRHRETLALEMQKHESAEISTNQRWGYERQMDPNFKDLPTSQQEVVKEVTRTGRFPKSS